MTPAQNAKNLLADIIAPLVASEVPITGAIGLTSAAFGKMHVCSGTSADYTVDLPAVAVSAGKLIGFRMSSALTKLVTLDAASTELIDGLQTRVMWANEVAILYCDGASWTKIAGKTVAMSAMLYMDANQLFAASGYNVITYNKEYGVGAPGMADPSNNRILIRRSGVYNASSNCLWNNNNGTGGRTDLNISIGGASSINAIVTRPASGYTTQNTALLGWKATTGDLVLGNAQFAGGSFTTSCFEVSSFIFNQLQVVEVPTW
jgi:hypothetical protein